VIAGSEKDGLFCRYFVQDMSTTPPAYDAASGPTVGLNHPIQGIPQLKWPKGGAAYSHRSTAQNVHKSWCLISHRPYVPFAFTTKNAV
jgi:hypothetical protein